MESIHKCSKEKKIDSMDRKLNKLNTVVMETTNGDSLLSLAKHTAEKTDDMHDDLKQVLTFQTVVETQREMKREIRERQARRQQWLIGLLVGTGMALLAIVIALAKAPK